MRSILCIFLAVLGTAFTPPDDSIEGFESQGFQQYPWEMVGPVFWSVSTQSPYQGGFSAVSGSIGALQSTKISLTLNITESSSISFARKVSSENGFDFLRFYIDGVEQTKWSGNVTWGVATFGVSAGVHQFTWSYEKDGSGTSGSDCAWLDHIMLPPHQIAVATVLQTNKITKFKAEVYPNPAAHSTNLRLHLEKPSVFQIELADANGRLLSIIVPPRHFGVGTHIIPIELGLIPDGLCYVVLRSQTGTKWMSVLKERN
jgi:hypothetical protein